MKPSSLVLLLSMLALVLAGPTACKKKEAKQEQRLHGAWFLDADATVAQMPEEQQQMAGAFIQMMKIGIVFNEDETLEMHVSMMGQKDFQEGAYKVLEVGEDNMTIELTRDEAVDEEGNVVEDEPSQMIVTFLDEDRISFKPVAEEGQTQEEADDETLILKRITKEELEKELEGAEQPSLEDLGLDMDDLVAPDQELDADGEGLEGADVDADADADADAADADAEAVDADEADADAEDADAAE